MHQLGVRRTVGGSGSTCAVADGPGVQCLWVGRERRWGWGVRVLVLGGCTRGCMRGCVRGSGLPVPPLSSDARDAVISFDAFPHQDKLVEIMGGGERGGWGRGVAPLSRCGHHTVLTLQVWTATNQEKPKHLMMEITSPLAHISSSSCSCRPMARPKAPVSALEIATLRSKRSSSGVFHALPSPVDSGGQRFAPTMLLSCFAGGPSGPHS